MLLSVAAVRTFFFFIGIQIYAGLRWQSVKERGGGCHLSVKAALPSSRPGVLGQLASELASVTVEEWMLNNRAYSSWPPRPGRLAGLASRRDATGRRARASYNPLLLPEEEQRGSDGEGGRERLS